MWMVRLSYLNQEWNITKNLLFPGMLANAYNDGPLADGTQMGSTLNEIESVSPAAFLKPGASLRHRHSVIHFTGSEKELDKISHQAPWVFHWREYGNHFPI